MDCYDDIFDDQIFQFSPLCLSPSPEPFTSTMEFLQDPVMEETERVDEETFALVSNLAINEANPSTNLQSPDLIPFPETLTVLQNPPEMEQQQLSCNSQEHLQGNLPNEQLDQQSLLNQNAFNPFQGPTDFTMIDFDQLMEEENSGYAHPTMTQSFELPNHPQEQFPPVPLSQSYPSYPTCQPGPVASHSNMYNQQPPPLVLANRENELIAPRMVTDFARSQNYSSYPTYPNVPVSSQSNMYDHQPPPLVLTNRADAPPLIPRMVTDIPRSYPRQNQISMTRPLPQMPSISTSPDFHSNQGNVQELANQPSSTFSYPTLHTYAEMHPGSDLFSPLQNSLFVSHEVSYQKHVEYGEASSSPRRMSGVLGRRQRHYQNRSEHGESSSSAQRRRIVSPINVDSTAAPERLINKLYDPRYESLRLYIDPHLRKFNLM